MTRPEQESPQFTPTLRTYVGILKRFKPANRAGAIKKWHHCCLIATLALKVGWPAVGKACCDAFNIEGIYSFCRYLAVTGIVLIVVIVVTIIVVTFHCPHVRLVEHRTDQSLVDVRSGMKRMLHDV